MRTAPPSTPTLQELCEVARDGYAVRCRDVVKSYWTETGEVPALKGVSADFGSSAVTAVVGPSGSGKSSLLRIIAGLDRPTSGSVFVQSVEVTRMSRRALRRVLRNLVGYVFQAPAENFVSYLTIREHLRLAGRRVAGAGGNADEVLAKLGIEHRAEHLPRELSGGEQQRAAFAQVVMSGASLVVADEPTAELDGKSSEALLEVVQRLAADGVSFVLATHDARVGELAHETIEIEHGRISGSSGVDWSST